MEIVCPHCATSYNIDAEKLREGRTVRCARCKEVWIAKPQLALAMAGEVEWSEKPPAPAAPPDVSATAPQIESPPLAAEMPGGTDLVPVAAPSPAPIIDATPPRPAPHDRRKSDRKASTKGGSAFGLPTAVAGMAALIGALLVWRGDVVKLMPQTAILYQSIGLEVNLRGLSFRDVKLGSETVDGKPVLVIEGVIIDEVKHPLEVPKLRFVVRDAKGTAIYAWNANAEQTVIEPGQRVPFRSRLAAPPEESHSIDVRFFNKRDLIGGAA